MDEHQLLLERCLASIEKPAYQMAFMATQQRDEALDLVQDAMYKLVQRYRDRPAEQWRPLFFRILNNRIMDWYRRQKVRGIMVFLGGGDGDEDERGIDSLPDHQSHRPERQIQQAQARAAMDTALKKLPLRQRQAMLLRVWEGFDVAETARIMECSEGSVKTHLHRATQALRRELGDIAL